MRSSTDRLILSASSEDVRIHGAADPSARAVATSSLTVASSSSATRSSISGSSARSEVLLDAHRQRRRLDFDPLVDVAIHARGFLVPGQRDCACTQRRTRVGEAAGLDELARLADRLPVFVVVDIGR